MENRTETRQVKRFLDLKEKIKAKEYFEVLIYHDPLFLIYGEGDIRYEVTARDMNEAISKALELHHEGWPTNTEGDKPSCIAKCQVVRVPDEQILDGMWKGDLSNYIYMEYWEPDIETKELIRLLEKNEPDWFPYQAHYIKKVWELDLLTGKPIQPLQKMDISLPERHGVEDLIRDCPKCETHMLHHVIKDKIEMWECFKVGCGYSQLLEKSNAN